MAAGYESYEHRLERLFKGWTDAEVTATMEAVREAPGRRDDRSRALAWSDIWREYARRTFPENLVCRRCGSDNHTEANHAFWMGED